MSSCRATNANETPAPRRAGTGIEDLSADRALQLIGDDPQTMLLVIQLMDHLTAKRSIAPAGTYSTREPY